MRPVLNSPAFHHEVCGHFDAAEVTINQIGPSSRTVQQFRVDGLSAGEIDSVKDTQLATVDTARRRAQRHPAGARSATRYEGTVMSEILYTTRWNDLTRRPLAGHTGSRLTKQDAGTTAGRASRSSTRAPVTRTAHHARCG